MRNIVFVLMIALVASCNLKPKSPEFVRVENIERPTYYGGVITLKGDMIFHNPNKIGFDIKSTDIDVFINQKKVYTIDNLKANDVQANSEFAIPFKIEFESDKVYKGFLSTGLGMLSSKSVVFKLEGTVDLEVKGIPFQEDISFSKEIKISK